MGSAITSKKKAAYSPHAELFGIPYNTRRSRCSLIIAHPNDEIFGSGCLISKLPKVQILHISDGAPRTQAEAVAAGFKTISDYTKARKEECISALELARIGTDQVFELNLPQFTAPLQLVELSTAILAFLQKTAPQIVLTHAYEGGHPDHDATAFATHAAIRLMKQSGLKPPVIFEMALYPGSKGLSKVPEFLHSPARESTTLVLDTRAQELKRRMFGRCKTQKQILERSPLGPEKFRQAPGYNFQEPPHDGLLHYEKFDWGMTGKEWRILAAEATKQLFGSTPETEQ
jgi:N-acetylglucosamine malate deacetylase 2